MSEVGIGKLFNKTPSEEISTQPDVPTGESFINAVGHSLVTGPVTNIKSLFAEDDDAQQVIQDSAVKAMRENPADGAAGFLGSVVGGIAPTALAIVGGIAFPPAAPALMYSTLAYYATQGAGAGRTKAFEFRRDTGKELSGTKEALIAGGYALSTTIFERMGIKGIRGITDKLSPIALMNIGKTIASQGSEASAKTIIREVSKVAGGSAIIEGAEEGFEQLATNAIDAIYDERGRGVENLVKGVPQSVAAGALGGALVGNLALGTHAYKTLGNIVQEEEFKIDLRDQIDAALPNVTREQVDASVDVMESNANYQGKQLSEYLVGIQVDEGGKGANIATRFQQDGKALFTVTKSKDVTISDMTGQMARVFRRNLQDEELKGIESEYGILDGKWSRAHENKFARNFQRWLRDGTGSRTQNDTFARYRDWMTNIHESVKKGPLATELTPASEYAYDVITGNRTAYRDEGQVEWMTRVSEVAHKWTRGMVGALSVQTNVDGVVNDRVEKGLLTQAMGPNGRSSTGVALKVYFSIITQHGARGVDLMERLKKEAKNFGLSQKDLIKFIDNDLPLLYESRSAYKTLSNEMRTFNATAVKILGEYFDDYKKQYGQFLTTKDEEFGFIESMTARIEEKISEARDQSDKNELVKLQATLATLKDTRFVHIPTQIWFETLLSKDPVRGRQILSVLAKQKRKTLTIQSLLDPEGDGSVPGILRPDEIKLTDIIASYSRRAGKDLALLNVIKAMTNEGLAARIEKGVKLGKDFVAAPNSATILKGYMLHREVNDWVGDMTRYNDKMSILSKGLNMTKMAAFFNPLFLPMYDLIQAAMLGVFSPIGFKKNDTGKIEIQLLPGIKAFRDGLNDAHNFTKEWQDARYDGLESKPFSNPLLGHRELFKGVLERGGVTGNQIRQLATPAMLKAAYNLSWRTAWYLDGVVRQVSYRYLLNKGFSSIEAAQTAAMYHGDYAGVPAPTRKLLNKVFFTPTFKIAMGKLYLNMFQGALQSSGALVSGELKNTPKNIKMNALALVNTMAILGAWHIFMQSLGFDDDEFGRRYKRKVETDEGMKEQIITWSGPHNLFLKYLSRATSSVGPEKQNPALTFFKSNNWEIHPLWRTMANTLINEKQDGSKIYNVGDSVYQKALKSASFMTLEINTLMRLVSQEFTTEELGLKQERELLAKEVGMMFEMLTRPFTFSYTRSTKEARISRQAKALFSSLKEEASRFAKEGKPIPEENINRMLMRIDAVLAELEET